MTRLTDNVNSRSFSVIGFIQIPPRWLLKSRFLGPASCSATLLGEAGVRRLCNRNPVMNI
jgi:hypothetical protein